MSFLHLAFRSVTTRHVASSSFSRLQMSRLPQRAAFSAARSLEKPQIETRVIDILKTFEKVSSEKVRSGSCVSARFTLCSRRSTPLPRSRMI
jgi:hypothetical protein